MGSWNGSQGTGHVPGNVRSTSVSRFVSARGTPFDLDQCAAHGSGVFGSSSLPQWVGGRSQEDTMLAPNPKAELFVDHGEDANPASSMFQKLFFVGVLIVAYAIAAAALLYPVLMYVWW
jgi:hypothetical protein